MKLLIRFAMVVLWLMGGVSAVCANAADVWLTENEAYVLLDHLLDLPVANNDKSAQLQRYKKWANLRAKLARENKLSNSQMKIYLFMVFIAEQRAKIDSLEEMAKEIVPMFKKQPTVLLGVLKESPFLLPAACNNINVHFELYGAERDKQKFLENYQGMITQTLGVEFSAACLAKIRVP